MEKRDIYKKASRWSSKGFAKRLNTRGKRRLAKMALRSNG